MKAAIYDRFRSPLAVTEVADPEPHDDGVVLAVKATGVCRSDWHGWMGHDRDIRLPHVPGHEIAGEIVALGKNVSAFAVGERVTLPFVCGCGSCEQCTEGNQQVCDRQSQPGFTHWGSYAEYVAVRYADHNLVRLPEALDFVTAASLGCRFATAYRAVVAQGNLEPDQWLAVHACGGVGLSAIMIAAAMGARVVAVDIDAQALRLARRFGAAGVIDARRVSDVPAAVLDLTSGGAHVSVDALGSAVTFANSLASLRKRGKHVQVGLLVAEDSSQPVAMDRIIANELEIIGSHGMQAHCYGDMLDLIVSGKVDAAALVQRRISLEQAATLLANETPKALPGVSVIDRFGDADA